MHIALELRLKWLLNEYLPETPGERRLRVLDVGRYESEKLARHQLLDDGRFEYVRLEAEDSPSHAKTMKNPYCWPEIATGSCDLAICTHALEHVVFPERTLAEVSRVLRPSGLVCIIEPGIPEEYNQYYWKHSVPAYNRHSHLPDYHRFTPEGLRALAESCRLSVRHASMNMGTETSPQEWFSMSEVILIAGKEGATAPPDGEKARDSGTELLPVPYYAGPGGQKRRDTATPYQTEYRKKKKKVLVLGPCTGYEIMLYLRVALHDYEVHYKYPKYLWDERTGKSSIYLGGERELEGADTLIVPDGESLDDPPAGIEKIIRFPIVRFFCFHPDFRARTSRSSVSGSAIVAESFLRGYSEEKALSFFHHGTYERLGYYSALGNDLPEMEKNFSRVGLNLRNFLPSWMRRGVFMVEPIHARDFVYADIMGALCSANGLQPAPAVETLNFDNMARRIPVYPEIAAYWGFPDEGSYSFRRSYPPLAPFDWEDSIELDEFIHISYLEYTARPELVSGENFPRLENL